ASSGTFALVVAALLAVGLLGLLALNTLISQGAFAATDASRQQARLADQEEQLQEEVARLESPEQLGEAATRLGMVGTLDPAFIDPRTGRVLGVPVPGQPLWHPAPATTAAPGPTAGATAAAKPSTSAGPSATTPPSGQPSPSAGHTAGAAPTPAPSATRTR